MFLHACIWGAERRGSVVMLRLVFRAATVSLDPGFIQKPVLADAVFFWYAMSTVDYGLLKFSRGHFEVNWRMEFCWQYVSIQIGVLQWSCGSSMYHRDRVVVVELCQQYVSSR
jgi:hypothetical protein